MSIGELKSAVGLKTKLNTENNTITLEFKMPENSLIPVVSNEYINFIFDNNKYKVTTFRDILIKVVEAIGPKNIYENFKVIINKEIDLPIIVSKEEHDVKYKDYFSKTSLAWAKVSGDYYVCINYGGIDTIIFADRLATYFKKTFIVDYFNMPDKLKWDDRTFFIHLKKIKYSKIFIAN